MNEEIYRIFDIGLKIITVALIMIAYYQLREAKQKRHTDMYWKIAEVYNSDEQRNARSNIHLIRHFVEQLQNESLGDPEIIKRYNQDYHVSTNMEQRGIDRTIIHRIRFLNQTGVLLRKNLVDRDLLFGLIGVGFEYDFPIIKIVLEAHRGQHGMQYIYKELEGLWSNYQQWKNKFA